MSYSVVTIFIRDLIRGSWKGFDDTEFMKEIGNSQTERMSGEPGENRFINLPLDLGLIKSYFFIKRKRDPSLSLGYIRTVTFGSTG